MKKRGGYRKTQEEFIVQAKKAHDNFYDYSLTQYISTHKKVWVVCPKHGKFLTLPKDHIRLLANGGPSGCPTCDEVRGQSVLLTLTEFIERASKMHEDKFDYSKSIYTNAHDKILIVCPAHGEFWQEAYNHLRGFGCSRCIESRGERFVRQFLEKNRIRYEHQVCVIDNKSCLNPKTGKHLYFDFYLPGFRTCIEYDGEQHFSSTEIRGSWSNLQSQQQRDIVKNNFCKKNRIRLLRIPYWESKNISTLITQFLNGITQTSKRQPS